MRAAWQKQGGTNPSLNFFPVGLVFISPLGQHLKGKLHLLIYKDAVWLPFEKRPLIMARY